MSDSLPPSASPPPVLPPPAPPVAIARPGPRSSGGGWKIFALLVSLVLIVSLVINLVLSMGSLGGMAGGPPRRGGLVRLHEHLIEDNGARDKVLVLDIAGVISGQPIAYDGSSMVDMLAAQFEQAAEDEEVKAVILKMDSPGGEVLASDEIYRLMRRFQASNDIPVVTVMGSLAASGGYYVSAASRWIVANELTITGSIGVIFHGYNYRGLMDKVGVLPSVVKSGKLKDMFSGEKRPEDELPEEKAILQGMVAESFARFKTVIREGRSEAAKLNEAEDVKDYRKLAENWEDFADGRIMSGNTALELGLVDELGNFDTAVDRALQLAGLETANLVTYHAPPTFGDFFRLFGKTDVKTVRVEMGGLDLAPRLPQGRLYFISPLHLH